MYKALLCFAVITVASAADKTKFCHSNCTLVEKIKDTFTCQHSTSPVADLLAGKCDIAIASANNLVDHEKDLTIVAAGVYGKKGPVRYYGLAVVRKDSGIDSLAKLKNKTSCHTGVGKTTGWVIPVGTLLRKKVMEYKTNQYVSVANFFNGSCAPGIKDKKQTKAVTDKLCSICKGGCDSKSDYADYDGAVKCLTDGAGHVAFTKESYLPKTNKENYRLLCADGGLKKLYQFEACYLGKRPAEVIVTTKGKDAMSTTYRAQIRNSTDFASVMDDGITVVEVYRKTIKDYLGDYLLNKNALTPGDEPTGDKPTGDEPTGDEPTGAASHVILWNILMALPFFLVAFWA